MVVKTTVATAAEVEVVAGEPSSGVMATEPVADGCDTCPARSTAEDSSFGYCEGCEGRLRRCPSCGGFRPQAGWGYGFSGLTWRRVDWVCAACRFRPDAAAGPDRFAVALGVEGQARTALAYELDRAAQRNRAHPVAEVLERCARSIEATGQVDVDVGEFDQDARRALLQVTIQVAGSMPAHMYAVADRLHRGWAGLVAEGEPAPPAAPRVPSVAERCAWIERPA